MLRGPEPTKERIEATTLGITAIDIPHSTRFTLLLLLRIECYTVSGVIMTPHVVVLDGEI